MLVRTQVYLPEEDVQIIAALAIQRRVPRARIMREVVREGVEGISRKKNGGKVSAYAALKSISKIGASGPTDLSEKMDEYLYGKKSKYA
jgi:hypothetical protein